MTAETIGILLSISFGLWAGVVGWVGKMLITRMDKAGRDLQAIDHHLQQFITATEARLTRLETNHIAMEKRVDDLRRRNGI